MNHAKLLYAWEKSNIEEYNNILCPFNVHEINKCLKVLL